MNHVGVQQPFILPNKTEVISIVIEDPKTSKYCCYFATVFLFNLFLTVEFWLHYLL